MKLLLYILFTLFSFQSVAQTWHIPTEKIIEKMQVFNEIVGEWEGEILEVSEDYRAEYIQKLSVEYKLDQTILVISGSKIHNESNSILAGESMMTIYFDSDKEEYCVNAHLNDGQYASAKMEISAKGKMKWWFEVPGGNVIFKISFDQEAWLEEGFFILREGNEYKFSEMKLRKL